MERDLRWIKWLLAVLALCIGVIAFDAGMRILERLDFIEGRPNEVVVSNSTPVDVAVDDASPPLQVDLVRLSLQADGSSGWIPVWTPVITTEDGATTALNLPVSLRDSISIDVSTFSPLPVKVQNSLLDPVQVSVVP